MVIVMVLYKYSMCDSNKKDITSIPLYSVNLGTSWATLLHISGDEVASEPISASQYGDCHIRTTRTFQG